MSIVRILRGKEDREAFAERIHVSYSTVRRLEANPLPPPETIAEIILRTGVDVDTAVADYVRQAQIVLEGLIKRERHQLRTDA